MLVNFRFSFLLIFYFIMLSCQTEEVDLHVEEQADEMFNEVLPEEYFKASVDGEVLLITNENVKSADERAVGAEIYEWQDIQGNKFNALRIWAKRKGKSKDLQTLGGFIDKYFGTGVYQTGTNSNWNYCHYLDYGISWYSDVYRGEEFKGEIEIITDSGDLVEGIMNYKGFNANDPSKFKEIIVEFRVFYEE
ncbi:hypothetical protein [Gramella sp. KN1008]|uniref:hypothetical protein n=1 Tax=Gramella sp. KN1008 TaxID=2529298 RepID=UPI00103F7D87|nr:hypothetical protein [Gramella sp. KN1008]TBW27888.1 hypothetical protein EZJ28_09115 [Gramella sp. KN1008]